MACNLLCAKMNSYKITRPGLVPMISWFALALYVRNFSPTTLKSTQVTSAETKVCLRVNSVREDKVDFVPTPMS